MIPLLSEEYVTMILIVIGSRTASMLLDKQEAASTGMAGCRRIVTGGLGF